MAKRRKYGDAWKDVQIDAEQNDAVFDRFFKRTSQPSVTEPDTDFGELPETVEPSQITARSSARTPVTPNQPVEKRSQAKATVAQIDPTADSNASGGSDIANQVQSLKQQYRLSKGEAAILKQLLQRAQDAGSSECYAKIPELADTCAMTHRGCQFALKSLQDRDFIVRLKDYDPADRLGILFLIKLPSA
jgi:hypothetical protein